MSQNNRRSPANIILAGVIVFLLALSLFIALNKFSNGDEMETLSAASFIFDGKVPYRDFWQMHTPFSYYFFAPLFLFFKTIKIFYAARLISYLLLLLNGYLLFIIARYLFSRKIAIFSFLTYLVSLPVLYKMTEIRPDVLVVLFSNLSLLFLLWNKLPTAKSFFLAGIFSAFALLSKQSGIIFIFGVLIFFIFRRLTGSSQFWDNKIFSKERFNARNYSFFLGGLLLPCIIFIFLLLSQGAFRPFLRYAINNDFLKAALLSETETIYVPPGRFLITMLLTNFLLFLSLIISFFYLFFKKQSIIKFANAYLFIFILLFVSYISLFLTLQVWEQDFLLFSQYLALLSAVMLSFFYEYIYELCRKRNREFLGAVSGFCIFALLCLPPLFTRPQRIRAAEWFFGLHRQLRPFDEVISLTNKDDRCLSIDVHYPFRPGPYFYRVTFPDFESPKVIEHIEKSLIDEILHNNIVVVIPLKGYAIGMPNLAQTIERNYVLYNKKHFYIPGKILQAAGRKVTAFDIIVNGYYRVPEDYKGMRIDNKLLKTDIVYLKKGKHIAYLPARHKNYRVMYDLQVNKRQVQ